MPIPGPLHHILDVSQDGQTPTWPISHEAVLAICFLGALVIVVIIMRWKHRHSNGAGIGFRSCGRKLLAKLTGRSTEPAPTLPTSMTPEMIEARQAAISAQPPNIAETFFEFLPQYTEPANGTHIYPPPQPQPPPPAYLPAAQDAPPYRDIAPPLAVTLSRDSDDPTPPVPPLSRSGSVAGSSDRAEPDATLPVASSALS